MEEAFPTAMESRQAGRLEVLLSVHAPWCEEESIGLD
jgi:hypothetical protein